MLLVDFDVCLSESEGNCNFSLDFLLCLFCLGELLAPSLYLPGFELRIINLSHVTFMFA